MTHQCAALGCSTQVDNSVLMCRMHWWRVSRETQNEVYKHYRPGQTIHSATEAYKRALIQAQKEASVMRGNSNVADSMKKDPLDDL